jgi:hypothetical protein
MKRRIIGPDAGGGMQRIENGGLIVSCDFCGVDWDGRSPVIEGHRGSIICLECLKTGLDGLSTGDQPYQCTLCLRQPIPPAIPRWHHPSHPRTFACRDCIQQTADVFDRDVDVPWTWKSRPGR